MKADKEILTIITHKCKEYPCTTIFSGIGFSFCLVVTIALGGMGYMIDIKNNTNKKENDNYEN